MKKILLILACLSVVTAQIAFGGCDNDKPENYGSFDTDTNASDDSAKPSDGDGKTDEIQVYFLNEDEKTFTPRTINSDKTNAPAVPERNGYSGEWLYETKNGRTEARPVYTTIEYTLKFVYNGTELARFTYTVEDFSAIQEPPVPPLTGQVAKWNEDYKTQLATGGNITVELDCSYVEYTISFYEDADGEPTYELTYTVIDSGVEIPPAPVNGDGVEGVWEEFLSKLEYGGDIRVNAIYPPVNGNGTGNENGDGNGDGNGGTDPSLPATKDEFFEWARVDGGYAATNYTGSDEVVIMPSAHDGEPVVEISDNAFNSNQTVKEIAINNSVTRIGSSAFENCANLEKVTLPDNLETLKIQVFYRCVSLTEIHLPDNLKTISKSAFNNCESLANIEIPDGVTSIGAMAFGGCASLTEIAIPQSAAYHDSAFPEWIQIIRK